MHTRFRLPALAAFFLSGAFSAWAADAPVKGGTLIYLEQQPHTNLYPPAGGFYPNGGILNQITDKLTWQIQKPYKSNRGLPKAGAPTRIKPNIPLRYALASPF
ncbi:ABC-type dipeptide transport system [Klebsiella michiganensis]|nr:ABC-type dipeptide transport system [Klebsiella michiganensis]